VIIITEYPWSPSCRTITCWLRHNIPTQFESCEGTSDGVFGDIKQNGNNGDRECACEPDGYPLQIHRDGTCWHSTSKLCLQRVVNGRGRAVHAWLRVTTLNEEDGRLLEKHSANAFQVDAGSRPRLSLLSRFVLILIRYVLLSHLLYACFRAPMKLRLWS
jgi:hypothetical protein